MQPGSRPYPSPGPPPPSGTDQAVRPSTWWFVVAGLVAVAGIAGAGVLLVLGVTRFADRIDGFDRAELPATLRVEITETGGYSIYHEYNGASDDAVRLDPEVTVTDPSGEPVPVDTYDASVTYETPSHEGRGAFTFDAVETGTYDVTAAGPVGSSVAVGRGIGRGLFAAIGGALLMGLGGVVAGVVMAMVVGVRRSRHRRTLAPPVAGGPPSPPPPPPPPPGSAATSASPWAGAAAPSAAGGSAPYRAVAAAAEPLARPAPGRERAGVARRIADPPSLRAPADWARGDVPLHWSGRS